VKVFAIIVTYNPSLTSLLDLLNSLYGQVFQIVIVNNGDKLNFDFEISNLHQIDLNSNYGIALAQNVGLTYCIDQGADFVITSDQDSIFPIDYVKSMYEIFLINKSRYKICCLAPSFRNLVVGNKILPYVYFQGYQLKTSFIFKNSLAFPSHVISSGMFIPVDAIKEVGFMNEDLFIDWVDTEWCWRALYKNFTILQTDRLLLNHNLGDIAAEFMGRVYYKHTPVRYYYSIRNSLYMFIYSKEFNKNYKFYLFYKIYKTCLFFLITSFSIRTLKLICYSHKDVFLKRMKKFSYEE
jgi:rhamnosyltransferase